MGVKPEVSHSAFRLIVQFSLLASIALVVYGIYQLLQGSLGPGLAGIGLGILALVPSQYFRIRPDPEAENVLLFITKQDCLLCDEARIVLRSAIEGTPFQVQELDLRDHRYLRRFKNAIPVVLWQGDELARLRVDGPEIRRRLEEILAERANRAVGGPVPAS